MKKELESEGSFIEPIERRVDRLLELPREGKKTQFWILKKGQNDG